MRRYLNAPKAARCKPRRPRKTKLEPFKPYVLGRIEAARPHWISAADLLREIKERGYEGCAMSDDARNWPPDDTRN